MLKLVVNVLRGRVDPLVVWFARCRTVAEKSEFVDMISEATPQARRRIVRQVAEPEIKETSRLSHWPPDRWQQWRMETLTPWKIRSWRFKDWS